MRVLSAAAAQHNAAADLAAAHALEHRVHLGQWLGLGDAAQLAGGRFTDIDGTDSISSRSSLATNGTLHDAFLDLLHTPSEDR